jgi:hypothetical protein
MYQGWAVEAEIEAGGTRHVKHTRWHAGTPLPAPTGAFRILETISGGATVSVSAEAPHLYCYSAGITTWARPGPRVRRRLHRGPYTAGTYTLAHTAQAPTPWPVQRRYLHRGPYSTGTYTVARTALALAPWPVHRSRLLRSHLHRSGGRREPQGHGHLHHHGTAVSPRGTVPPTSQAPTLAGGGGPQHPLGRATDSRKGVQVE